MNTLMQLSCKNWTKQSPDGMKTTDFCTIYKILQSYELRIFQHNDLDSLRKQPIHFEKSAGIIGLLQTLTWILLENKQFTFRNLQR